MRKTNTMSDTLIPLYEQIEVERDMLLAALKAPLSDEEQEMLCDHSYDDGWCPHDVAGQPIVLMFSRVLSARLKAVKAKTEGGAA